MKIGKYYKVKALANQQVCFWLDSKEDNWPGVDGTLLEALERALGNDSYIEVGSAWGDGDNSGYYKCALILDLEAYREERYDNVIRFEIGWVHQPDAGHDWDVREYYQDGLAGVFTKGHVLVEYMRIFVSIDACRRELFRLLSRTEQASGEDSSHPGLCISGDDGGLSFV